MLEILTCAWKKASRYPWPARAHVGKIERVASLPSLLSPRPLIFLHLKYSEQVASIRHAVVRRFSELREGRFALRRRAIVASAFFSSQVEEKTPIYCSEPTRFEKIIKYYLEDLAAVEMVMEMTPI